MTLVFHCGRPGVLVLAHVAMVYSGVHENAK